MENKKLLLLSDRYRPSAFAPVGDFFIIIESLHGSIFCLWVINGD
jgi:hypothetical protein